MQRTGRFRFSSSRWVVLGIVAAAAVVGGFQVVPWAAATTSSGDRAIFEPLPPARILDTRSTANPLTAGESRTLVVTGVGGVPADATAVVLNVTVVSPTSGGFLTLHPADAPLPDASNLNFLPGQTVPNAVTVKLGGPGPNLGRIKIFNSAGQTQVIVDVNGYYRAHNHDDRYHTKAEAFATTRSSTATADLADGAKASYEVFCPAGQQAIGGGGRGDDASSEATSVTSSRPAISASNSEPPADGFGFTGWRITVSNLPGGITTGIRPAVWVICIAA